MNKMKKKRSLSRGQNDNNENDENENAENDNADSFHYEISLKQSKHLFDHDSVFGEVWTL